MSLDLDLRSENALSSVLCLLFLNLLSHRLSRNHLRLVNASCFMGGHPSDLIRCDLLGHGIVMIPCETTVST